MVKLLRVITAVALVAAALVVLGGPATAGGFYLVTTEADAGPGSFRQGLADGASSFAFAADVETINIDAPLVYDGADPLTIKGSGQTIIGNGDGETLLGVLSGVDVSIRNLDFDDDLFFNGYNSEFMGTGADGIELDERGPGNVYFDVAFLHFEANGDYCVPAPLVLEEPCIEDDDGTLVPDLDDAFDIDEADNGWIHGYGANLVFIDNYDEGLDFDEEGSGGIHVVVSKLTGTGNFDEAIKFSEEGPGPLFANLSQVEVSANLNNDGVQLEEEDGGDVNVTVTNSSFTDHDEGDGLKIQESDGGDTAVVISGITAAGNDSDDVQLDGNGRAKIRDSVIDDLDVDDDITLM